MELVDALKSSSVVTYARSPTTRRRTLRGGCEQRRRHLEGRPVKRSPVPCEWFSFKEGQRMSRISTVAAVLCLLVFTSYSAKRLYRCSPRSPLIRRMAAKSMPSPRYRQSGWGPRPRPEPVTIQLSRDGGATFQALGTIDNTVKNVSLRNALAFTVTGPGIKQLCGQAIGTVGNKSITMVSSPFSIGCAGAPLPGSVTSGSLAPASVTTPSIANEAVTTANIANEAVGVQQISSGAALADFVLQADG